MTLEELLIRVPALEEYIRYMPAELRSRCTVRIFPKGTIIHQKDEVLTYFGIVCQGSHRVINEFENGNIFMIERNDPIDFVGEVTILAGKERTSVSIEAITDCTILFFSRKDFEEWIKQDIHFLRLVSQRVAYKLYRSSYNRGNRLFYPPNYLLLDYVVNYVQDRGGCQKEIVVGKTRQDLCEETGISVKTLNRTVQKLKQEGRIGIVKGKISVNREQYDQARAYINKEKQITEKVRKEQAPE